MCLTGMEIMLKKNDYFHMQNTNSLFFLGGGGGGGYNI